MTLFDSQFDILGIMVAAPDDNQVLEPTGDEQFIVLKKAQVSSAQKWTFARICQIGVERTLCLFRLLPVALGDAGTADPNLADLIRQALGEGLRIDNDDLLALYRLTATHERVGTFRCRCCLSDNDLVVFERSCQECSDDG